MIFLASANNETGTARHDAGRGHRFTGVQGPIAKAGLCDEERRQGTGPTGRDHRWLPGCAYRSATCRSTAVSVADGFHFAGMQRVDGRASRSAIRRQIAGRPLRPARRSLASDCRRKQCGSSLHDLRGLAQRRPLSARKHIGTGSRRIRSAAGGASLIRARSARRASCALPGSDPARLGQQRAQRPLAVAGGRAGRNSRPRASPRAADHPLQLACGAGGSSSVSGGEASVHALRPFIGDQDHRLGEVERAEFGIDRHGDDRAGERDIVGFEPRSLRPEQDRRCGPGAAWISRAGLLRA